MKIPERVNKEYLKDRNNVLDYIVTLILLNNITLGVGKKNRGLTLSHPVFSLASNSPIAFSTTVRKLLEEKDVFLDMKTNTMHSSPDK